MLNFFCKVVFVIPQLSYNLDIVLTYVISLCWLEVVVLLRLCFLLFQLTAFSGDLKYTVSYDIPMESVDSDIVSSVDVIIQVDFFFSLLLFRCY